MATGSHDKTVRLWRLPEGKLLRTLRRPIGPGNDGHVYAVAMAPDGSWVAAGGWSSPMSHYVYIFHTSTGAMIARLGPVGNVIGHLAVSSDGRYLAATLGRGHGLRVWKRSAEGAAAWRLVVDDRDYGGQRALGAAFDREGALYTVAYDGRLRRYAPGFQGGPTWVTTRGGKHPHSVAVHPSGDSVAVGYADTTAVEVYDAATLAWRFAADTKSATTSDNNLGVNLAGVAWSTDGSLLYAGGTFGRVLARGDHSPILVWDRTGKGRVRLEDRKVPLATYCAAATALPSVLRTRCSGFCLATGTAWCGRPLCRPTRVSGTVLTKRWPLRRTVAASGSLLSTWGRARSCSTSPPNS